MFARPISGGPSQSPKRLIRMTAHHGISEKKETVIFGQVLIFRATHEGIIYKAHSPKFPKASLRMKTRIFIHYGNNKTTYY